MAKDYLNAPPTTMRRNDRAVEDDTWIMDFLKHAPVGTLATVHDAQPFTNTNLFIYNEEQHCIYTHTARVGRTRANVDEHQKVNFSVMEMGRLLPADEALEFSVEYAGVSIFGHARVVEDEAEATDALQQMLDKYAPHLAAGADYRPPVPEELKRTTVFRIDIEAWSGKKKQVEDFEGAYWYPEEPVLPSVKCRSVWNGSVSEIFISAEKGLPVDSVSSVNAVAYRGLEGDRHFNHGEIITEGEIPDVTLIAIEDLEAIRAEIGIEIQPEQSRRNILTQGVPITHLAGKKFRVGEVLMQGVELCEPCNGMAQASGHGVPLLKAMVHRGGIRARILSDGVIHPGDRICPVEV